MCKKTILWCSVLGICGAAQVAAGGSAATKPEPANGAVGVTMPLLKWTKGDAAVFHNVYLGTTPDLTEANLVASRQPFEMYYHIPGFTPGATYYWRVDEIEGNGTVHPGNVWSFIVQAQTAYYPGPADGATDIVLAPTLTWMPGALAAKHHLYFGAGRDAVSQGAAEADKGLLDLEVTRFALSGLESLTTYYWRVDEVLADQTVRAGPVWQFTTFVFVDDFESYNDDLEAKTTIFDTWIDGFTNGLSGSTVGNAQAPFAEQAIVHGGKQAMPLDYNNVASPYYSEAERVWATPQDWSVAGITTLTLYFRGTSANASEKLYVSLTDQSGKTGTVMYPTAGPVAMSAWTRWQVLLSEFSAAGVNLGAVKKVVIGLGDRANPKAGGAGRLYIDDIYAGGLGSPVRTALFAEDFEGLKLGPKVDEGLAGDKVWTKTPPPGWSIDDTGVPGVGNPATDGVTEWAGWSFANRLWWVETAGDQDRSQFTKGLGAVAIADPDEWDDATHADAAAAGWYKTFLSTPPIDIATAAPGTLTLKFDSSWKPEFDDDYHQTANVKVAFDGGTPIQLLLWVSESGNPNYHPNATNETVVLPIDAPAGAKTMVLTFSLFDAGNDWWWAIDNLDISAMTK
jgi:hypothetical protein